MALSGVVTLVLALGAGADARVLLCRPHVAGDAALARGEAVTEAGRRERARFLDYGVACEGAAEGARAARRAGLRHAVTATAEGRTDGSRYGLVLSDARSEAKLAARDVVVSPGADPVKPLATALRDLSQSIPPPPGAKRHGVGPWLVVGAGVALAAAGTVLAVQAKDAADEANGAVTPGAYASAKERWSDRRMQSGIALGAGGALVAAGLTWRFVF